MVKSLAATVSKWQRRTANATAEYTTGVQQTTKDWNTLTSGAAANWANGVTDAINRGAFATGVQKVSTAQWKAATAAKSGRWAEGIRVGSPKYQAAMGAVLQNIASIVSGLGPRGPRGSEQNFERSVAFQRAMAATRTGGGSGYTAPATPGLF